MAATSGCRRHRDAAAICEAPARGKENAYAAAVIAPADATRDNRRPRGLIGFVFNTCVACAAARRLESRAAGGPAGG